MPSASSKRARSAADSQWIFTTDDLNRTPSRLDGMSLEKERQNRAKGVHFITQACMMLKLTQLTVSTATIYLHRFFMRYSMVDKPGRPAFHYYVSCLSLSFPVLISLKLTRCHDPKAIAATSLFLATKVEETCRRMKELVVACCRVAQKNPTLLVDEQSKEYWRWRDTILHNEDVLLEALCFDLSYDKPFLMLLEYLNELGEQHNGPLRSLAWDFLADSGATMLGVLYPSRVIAASAVYCAARCCRIKYGDRDNGAWWEEFGISLSDIKKVCNHMALARDEVRARPMYTLIPEDETPDKAETGAKTASTSGPALTGRDAQPRPKRSRDDGGSTADGAAKHGKNDAVCKVGASTTGGNAHGAPKPSNGRSVQDKKRRSTESAESAPGQNGEAGASTAGSKVHGAPQLPNSAKGHDTKRRSTESAESAPIHKSAAATPVEDTVGKVRASATEKNAHGASKPSNGHSGQDKKRRSTESAESAPVKSSAIRTPVENGVGKVEASAADKTAHGATGAPKPSNDHSGHDKKRRRTEDVEATPVQTGNIKTPANKAIGEVGASTTGSNAHSAPEPLSVRSGHDKKRRRTESIEGAPAQNGAVKASIESAIGKVGASATDENAHGASRPSNGRSGHDKKRRSPESIEPTPVQNDAIVTPVESVIGKVGASAADENSHGASKPSNGHSGHDKKRRRTESVEPAVTTPVGDTVGKVGASATDDKAQGTSQPSSGRSGQDKKRRRTESVEPAVATPVESAIGETGAPATDDSAHGTSQPLDDQNGRDKKRRRTGSAEPVAVQNGEVGASTTEDNAHGTTPPMNNQNEQNTKRQSTENVEPAPVQTDAVATPAAEDALSEEGEVES